MKFSHILNFVDCIATMVLCFCFVMFLYPLYLLKIENSTNGLIIISSDFLGRGTNFVGGSVYFCHKVPHPFHLTISVPIALNYCFRGLHCLLCSLESQEWKQGDQLRDGCHNIGRDDTGLALD